MVRTRKLEREDAISFLEKGFNELGLSVPHYIIHRAVDELDGIIGWLTLFGYTCYLNYNKCLENFDSIVDQAVEVAREELEKLLSTRRSTRYRSLIKILAVERRWSENKET